MKQSFPGRAIPIFLLAALLALLALPTPVRADIAPPQMPGGSNLSPGEDTGTPVEMAYEQVTFIVGEEVDFQVEELDLQGVEAHVQAVFQMQNTSQTDETMQVRFPLVDPSGLGDGFTHVPKLQDFSVSIAGEPSDWINVETPNPNQPNDPPVQWAAFDVTFPAGETVEIQVDYSTHSTGYLPEASFNYILTTGAGWKGPIGEGDIILKMPYVASNENVLSWKFAPAPQPMLEEDEVRWHFQNLEPQKLDNWSVTIFSPKFMNEIYDLREVVADNPEDANALKDLGDLYLQAAEGKGIYKLRAGAEPYILLAEDAYLQSLVIRDQDLATVPTSAVTAEATNDSVIISTSAAPDDLTGDIDANVGYLELLAAHYLNADKLPNVPAPSLEKIINQLNVVYSLDPQNERARAIYEQLSLSVTDLPTPGAEPTFVSAGDLPTPTPTATRRVPPTPVPLAVTPIPTPRPVSPPPLGISNLGWLALSMVVLCLGGLLFVFVVLVVLFIRRRRG